METASKSEIAELLGTRADEVVIERIAELGVTTDEVSQALDDLEHEARSGETRIAASPKIEEIRTILDELPVIDQIPIAQSEEELAAQWQ